MSGENNHIRNEIDVIADAMADEEDDDYDPYDEVGDN